MVLLGAKVTNSAPDYLTMVGAGVVKYGEEKILAQTPIGNGTIVSGAVKLGIGYASHHFLGGNRLADMVSLGFTVDGVEDIMTSVLGGGGILGGLLGGGNATVNQW